MSFSNQGKINTCSSETPGAKTVADGHALETGGQRLAHRVHHLVDGWSWKDRRDYEQDQFPVRHAGSCYFARSIGR